MVADEHIHNCQQIGGGSALAAAPDMNMTTVCQKTPFKLVRVINGEQYNNNCGNELEATTTPVVPKSEPLANAEMPPQSTPEVIISDMRSQTQDLSEPLIDILINNVVCSFSVGCHLNLRQIALNGHNVEFRRESGMVTMKLRKPNVTASVWSSGKITCTGATSEEDARKGARRIARVIQRLGFNTKFRKMRIVNVLGSCSMPFEIKINAFSQHYREAEYEPELHPGVTYRFKNLKATLKIFSTGRITVTAPSVPNVQSAIEHIYPLVFDFRKEFASKEDMLRKRSLTQRNNQDKIKRTRLNSNSCSSNDEEDKEVESIMSR